MSNGGCDETPTAPPGIRDRETAKEAARAAGAPGIHEVATYTAVNLTVG